MRFARWLGVVALISTCGCHSLVELPRQEANDLLVEFRGHYQARNTAGVVERLAPEFRSEAGAEDALPGGLDGAAFEAHLAGELKGFAHIERVKTVLDAMRALDEDGTYEADALFRVWGVLQDGTHAFVERHLRLTLVGQPGAAEEEVDLRVRAWQVRERYDTRGSGRVFVERALEVGLDFKHTPHTPYDEEHKRLIPGLYSGAGVCAGDVDGDGWVDLLVGDGARCRLYRTRPGLDGIRFEEVTREAGLDGLDDVRGAYLVDLDDDGHLDVFLTRVKLPPLLYRNDGDGGFEDASSRLRELPPVQYESAAFADLDGDGDLDIYLVVYGDFEKTSFAFPLYDAQDGVPDVVLRNNGGVFAQVDVPAISETKGWGLAVAIADYDDDGDQDIYQVNDFGVNHLYRNDGDWAFTEVTEEAGVTDQGFGMSAAFGDYDGDGDLDIYVANLNSSSRWVFEDPGYELPGFAELFLRDHVRDEVFKVTRGNSLFENQGDGTFVQRAAELGVERAEWAWGATFFDYDNDGDLDVYCPNGFVTGAEPDDT
jgi:hypothetical protein